MQKNKIIYVQSNDNLANTFNEKFQENDIEMIHAKTGEEALDIAGREKVLLLLIDINLPDMRLRKFVDRIRAMSPQIILNVCVDVLDPLMITKLSNRHHIHKIYVAPWDVDAIVEGIKESIEVALINEETNVREEKITSEKEELEQTLDTLKTTLKKQQHSYSKLNSLTSCFTNALKEKEKSNPLADKRIEFAKETYEMMLKLQTTGSFDVERFEEYIKKDLEAIKEFSSGFFIGTVNSCLLGGQSRTKAQNIRFSIYLVARLYALAYDEFTIDISSHYLTTQEAEFNIKATTKGSNTKVSDEEYKEYSRYVGDMIGSLANTYRENRISDNEAEYHCSFIVTRE